MADREVGELIDELYQIREERRDISAQDKELATRFQETQAQVMKQLERHKLDKASGTLASVSLSRTVVPSVTDWTKLTRYIKSKAAFHLFERRLAKSAWVEEVQLRKGRELPGVEAFEKTGLNLSTR